MKIALTRGHGSVRPRTFWIRAVMIGAVCLIASFAPMSSPVAADSGNAAAQAELPAANLYPEGTTLTYLPSPSNREIDCDWGFVCDRHGFRHEHLFHTLTQDQMHRRDGWVQFGVWRQEGLVSQFDLVVSHYGAGVNSHGRDWSARALLDLDKASWLDGYRPLVHPIALGSVCGDVVEKRWSSRVDSALLLACRTGNSEIEAVTITDRTLAEDRRLVWHDLVQQIQWAAEIEGTSSSL